jgi:hypothetical protein
MKAGKRSGVSFRQLYAASGVGAFYKAIGPRYINPQESNIHEVLKIICATWPIDLSHVLDLAAGSGEVTVLLQSLGYSNIEGSDPYTNILYESRTRRRCMTYGFEDIARGQFLADRYSVVICSFALHLLAPSWLPGFLWGLQQITDTFLVVSPHKRPRISPEWGWTLVREKTRARVRTRLFLSGEVNSRQQTGIKDASTSPLTTQYSPLTTHSFLPTEDQDFSASVNCS